MAGWPGRTGWAGCSLRPSGAACALRAGGAAWPLGPARTLDVQLLLPCRALAPVAELDVAARLRIAYEFDTEDRRLGPLRTRDRGWNQEHQCQNAHEERLVHGKTTPFRVRVASPLLPGAILESERQMSTRGSEYDPDTRAGVSRFIEHLLLDC